MVNHLFRDMTGFAALDPSYGGCACCGRHPRPAEPMKLAAEVFANAKSKWHGGLTIAGPMKVQPTSGDRHEICRHRARTGRVYDCREQGLCPKIERRRRQVDQCMHR